MRHCVQSVAALDQALHLSPDERRSAEAAERNGLPIRITPHLLRLCDPEDLECPIRRQFVPDPHEQRRVPGDWHDPLGEDAHGVAPSLVQRYPDRALLLVTDQCAANCRFCTRRRLVGRAHGLGATHRLTQAFDYLRCHPEVHDVIVSGGDPLLLGTARLVRIVSALRRIASVETIRLATRVPCALPQRVSHELVNALRPFHPLWIMTHFNHPRELAPATRAACARFADAGFPLMNQTVLLRGVNDRAEVLGKLFRTLVRERVRPYYLLQADPAEGTGRFRTPLRVGVGLMAELQGRLSGIALPKLIVDTPGGGGKVPLCPNYVVGESEGTTRLRTPRGDEADYVDPP